MTIQVPSGSTSTKGAEVFGKEKSPALLTDEDLLFAHDLLHKWYERIIDGKSVEGWNQQEIMDYHILVLEELKSRGYKHVSHDQLDYDSLKGVEKVEEQKSEDHSGPDLLVKTVADPLSSIDLRDGFAWIVGGAAVHGSTEGKVEILIRSGDFSGEALEAIKARILREFSPEIQKRIVFIDDPEAPISKNVPIYALRLVRVNPEVEVREI